MNPKFVHAIAAKISELMDMLDTANASGERKEVALASLSVDCFVKALKMAAEAEIEDQVEYKLV